MLFDDNVPIMKWKTMINLWSCFPLVSGEERSTSYLCILSDSAHMVKNSGVWSIAEITETVVLVKYYLNLSSYTFNVMAAVNHNDQLH